MLNPLNWFKDGGVFKPVGDFVSGGFKTIGGGLNKAGGAIEDAGKKTGNAISGGANATVDWLGGQGNPLWQDEEDLDGNVL